LGSVLAVCAALTASFVPASSQAWQQYIRFDRITLADGLPEEYILSMAQDELGYLWLGTGVGLARYDGHQFRLYQANPDDPGALSAATVISVYVDGEGTVWAGTDAGLNRFDRATETFEHFRHDPDDPNSLGGNASRRYSRTAGETCGSVTGSAG